jgi:hypothetical protein
MTSLAASYLVGTSNFLTFILILITKFFLTGHLNELLRMSRKRTLVINLILQWVSFIIVHKYIYIPFWSCVTSSLCVCQLKLLVLMLVDGNALSFRSRSLFFLADRHFLSFSHCYNFSALCSICLSACYLSALFPVLNLPFFTMLSMHLHTSCGGV